MTDPYQSSTTGLVITWLVAIPVFCCIVQQLVVLFGKQEGVSRWLTYWIALCFLVLSPLRYLFFLLVVGVVFPFQSARAFFSLFGTGILGPFAFGLLYGVGVLLPLLLLYWIAGVGAEGRSMRNSVAAALLAPFVVLIGHLVFLCLAPLAAWTTSDLRADDLIRATNGPAYYIFCTVPSMDWPLPKYLHAPYTTRDCMRAHVVLIYLNKSDYAAFVKATNPDANAEVTSAD